MNKKYAAADAFYSLMQKHPDDFSAKVKSGRDTVSYLITNIYRAVSVTILHDTVGNTLTVENPEHGQGLNYVSGPTLRDMHEWAVAKIESEKVKAKIESDKNALNILIEFYSEK